MARIGVVEDNRDVCAVIARSLRDKHELNCFYSGLEAVRLLPAWQPDVVILDVCLDEQMDGFACLSGLKARGLSSRFVIITGYRPFDMLVKSRECGADAFLSKPFATIELSRTIEALLDGGQGKEVIQVRVVPQSDPPPPTASDPRGLLTEREREIIEKLSTLKSAKTMANALGVSLRTVQNHLHSIYRKLGAHNRKEAVSRWSAPAPQTIIRRHD